TTPSPVPTPTPPSKSRLAPDTPTTPPAHPATTATTPSAPNPHRQSRCPRARMLRQTMSRNPHKGRSQDVPPGCLSLTGSVGWKSGRGAGGRGVRRKLFSGGETGWSNEDPSELTTAGSSQAQIHVPVAGVEHDRRDGLGAQGRPVLADRADSAVSTVEVEVRRQHVHHRRPVHPLGRERRVDGGTSRL